MHGMSKVPSLIQFLRDRIDNRIVDEVLHYEAKIDSEWGCCHDATEIEAGLCPCTDPEQITLLQLLAEPLGWRPRG